MDIKSHIYILNYYSIKITFSTENYSTRITRPYSRPYSGINISNPYGAYFDNEYRQINKLSGDSFLQRLLKGLKQ